MKTSGRTVVLPATVRFAFIIGLLFLTEGAWELFRPAVFGVLTSNPLHGFMHLMLALLAIWAGRSGRARGFLIFLGVFQLLVGLLWYFDATGPMMVRLLNMNRASAYTHVFVGIVSVLVAFGSPRPRSSARARSGFARDRRSLPDRLGN